MKAYIAVIELPVSVVPNSGLCRYDCLNVTGQQVCFRALIYSDPNKIVSWSSEEGPLGICISQYIPISLFYGKREGDEVALRFLNKDKEVMNVDVKLNQKNFENILHQMTSSFGGVYVQNDKNDISEIKQCCYIITAHDQYSHSIGKPTLEPDQFKYNGMLSLLFETKRSSVSMDL